MNPVHSGGSVDQGSVFSGYPFFCFNSKCVVLENIHTCPAEAIFYKTPTPLKIPVKLHTFL